jgi:hypothetical protein
MILRNMCPPWTCVRVLICRPSTVAHLPPLDGTLHSDAQM